MARALSSVFMLLLLAPCVCAQTAPDAAELNRLLREFLGGASRNDAGIHERFWADDLIYTGSSGRRVGKADIMRDVRSAPAPKPGDPLTVFTAEDVRIQQYGDTAIVAFRLVGTIERAGRAEVANFLNTGTFLKRGGRWQVVSWQATRLPRTEDEVRKEVAATETAFQQALLAGDAKRLEPMLDESFVWTPRAGERLTRQQLLERLGAGQLKYSRPEGGNVTVNVYGDAALVRFAAAPRQGPAAAAGGAGAAAPPSTDFYTLTLVNRGGTWRAVALDSGRP